MNLGLPYTRIREDENIEIAFNRGLESRRVRYGEPIAAMMRTAEHWITNVEKGGRAEKVDPTVAMGGLVERSSAPVGGGLLGVESCAGEVGA